MREIWAAGGVGPRKLAVMARVAEPKTYLLGRIGDTPAACAFAACDHRIGMLQALEVAAPFRRRGLGTALTRAGAGWAAAQGATTFALAVEVANAPARAAYAPPRHGAGGRLPLPARARLVCVPIHGTGRVCMAPTAVVRERASLGCEGRKADGCGSDGAAQQSTEALTRPAVQGVASLARGRALSPPDRTMRAGWSPAGHRRSPNSRSRDASKPVGNT